MAAGKDGFSFGSRDQRILAKLVIAILSMDYDEVYVLFGLTLTATHGFDSCRAVSILGANSNFACPTCLVPKCELWNLGGEYPPRTKGAALALLREAEYMPTATQRYAILLRQSIRYMTVCRCVPTEFAMLNSRAPEHLPHILQQLH